MAQWRPGERVSADAGTSPPPPPDLPCFPAMRDYTRLRAALDGLGFRHLADALRPPAPPRAAAFGSATGSDDGFRVLDGLWFRGRGTLWERVDEEYVRRARAAWLSSGDPRAAAAVGVVDVLEAYVRHDPMGLRRVLLWQLACLLRDGSAGPTEEAAAALGVHREEAAHLAAAVAAGFPAAGEAREAAERLGDVWPGRRLREARRLAGQVHDTGRDPALTRLFAELSARRAELDQWTEEADRRAVRGDARGAAAAWFGAVRRAVDEPWLQAGLLGAAARAADAAPAGAGPRLDAALHERTVRLTWPPARAGAAPVTFRLLRFPDGSPDAATELGTWPPGPTTGQGPEGGDTAERPPAPEDTAEAPSEDRPTAAADTTSDTSEEQPTATADTASLTSQEQPPAAVGTAGEAGSGEPALPPADSDTPSGPPHHTDPDAPIGRPLRYAVVPLRGGLVAGVPLVSAPLVIAPDVAGVTTALVPDGVRLRWSADPACVAVAVERTSEGDAFADTVLVPCGRDGLLDVPLPAGTHRYEIRCAYPGPDDERVWSPGVLVSVRAEEWPGQVEDLTARLLGDGDRVALTWRPPDRGRSTVVPWPNGPVVAGTDVSRRAHLTDPEFPAGPEPSVEVTVPEGSRLRMTAVSVLGERKVSGPDVVVERPGSVRDLTVRRLSDDRAAVRFAWPEPAVLVLVVWEGGGRRAERRVARSAYLADGYVEIPVGTETYRVTVAAQPRPDALTVPTDAAVADLPAVPPPPRLLPPLLDASSLHGWWQRWRRWWPFGT
ncbi:hypothetical protein [Streptomyces bullii]|uniref:Uncharacterized protein n=1 Tax=Streptomyces bullii TaxID=349910 RepID=A0ABW0UNX0_9ACTN